MNVEAQIKHQQASPVVRLFPFRTCPILHLYPSHQARHTTSVQQGKTRLRTSTTTWILRATFILTLLCMPSGNVWSSSPNPKMTGVWQAWMELLKDPAIRNFPESKQLLNILTQQKLRTTISRGVAPLSWFAGICHQEVCINLTELRSKLRSFGIYATDANRWLQAGTRSSLYVYWSGGWKPWMWERALALKLLPGLIFATARVRFRQNVRSRLGWSYPLETQEELMIGLRAQAVWLSVVMKTPHLKALWDLVKFGKVDRSLRRLLQLWKSQQHKGLQLRVKQITRLPLNVLSPLYSLTPSKEVFHLSLSKKRPPFRLNRRRDDSLTKHSRKDLIRRIQKEQKMLKEYLDFCHSRIPKRIDTIISHRLARMHIANSSWQAMWYAYLWKPRLQAHYTNNLMLVPFTQQQEQNRKALKILNKLNSYVSLRATYQFVSKAMMSETPTTRPKTKP